MPLSRAMSLRGLTGRWMSAIIAVLVTRGSTTMRRAVALVALEALAEDGVVVGDVGADEQDDVGGLHVVVGAGRAIAAEGELVAGDGAGHAERGVAVVVAGAEAELHELAEGVELFGEELAGADDAERVVAVLLPGRARMRSTMVSRASSQETGTSLPSLRRSGCRGAAGGVEDVVFAEALGAELAAVDGVVGIAAHGDGFAVLDADQHAAADGAVAAGGLDPVVGDAGGGDVAEARIFCDRRSRTGACRCRACGEGCSRIMSGNLRE